MHTPANNTAPGTRAAAWLAAIVCLGASCAAPGPWNELHDRANRLYDEQRYFEACESARRAVVAARRETEPEELAVARALATLGRCYLAQNLYRDAERAFRQAFALFRRHAGYRDPQTADCMVPLARINEQLGRLPTASSLYREAMQTYVSRLGPDAKRTVQLRREIRAYCRRHRIPVADVSPHAVQADPSPPT